VVRGGSWINNGRRLRAANRNNDKPDRRNNNLGFRLAAARRGAFHGDQRSIQSL
jgi:formylglycine-generating enzyme required for sulfatase activity